MKRKGGPSGPPFFVVPRSRFFDHHPSDSRTAPQVLSPLQRTSPCVAREFIPLRPGSVSRIDRRLPIKKRGTGSGTRLTSRSFFTGNPFPCGGRQGPPAGRIPLRARIEAEPRSSDFRLEGRIPSRPPPHSYRINPGFSRPFGSRRFFESRTHSHFSPKCCFHFSCVKLMYPER